MKKRKLLLLCILISTVGFSQQKVLTKTGKLVSLVKADVGLDNVDNTSDANKSVSTATQTALDAKAPLASPALTGVPTAPTAASGTNTTQLATTAFVTAATGSFLPLAGGTMTGSIQGATLNLNNNAGTNTTTIGGGSTSGATTIGGGSIAVTPATAGTTVIGNTAGTGAITLGSSTAAQTTNIGAGAGVSTVNIATGSTTTNANLVQLGSTNSQVAVGAAPAEATAALAVNSTTKGFLPPRMTSAQMNDITSPATGLMVYCIDCTTPGLSYFTGTAWSNLVSPASAQGVTSLSSSFNFNCTGGGTFIITVANNTFSDVTLSFAASDITFSVASGANGPASGYSVSAVSPASATITSGSTAAIAYTITGATTRVFKDIVTATWSKLSPSNSKTITTDGGPTGVTASLGGTYSTFFNGITSGTSAGDGLSTYTTGEKFSANTNCNTMYISANHTAATCTGSVMGTSGTVYPLALINGQCWMTKNCNEKPTNIPIIPPTVANVAQWTTASTNYEWYGYYRGGG